MKTVSFYMKTFSGQGFLRHFYLTPTEIEQTRQILDAGVKVFIQQLPSTKRVDLTKENL